jgi:formate dehydrogenase subunit gamma
MPGYTQWHEDKARNLIRPFEQMAGGLLPALHALQAEFGYISDAGIRLAADVLNLSRAEVHGVVSFYHDFRRVPPGRHVVRLCRAEACQAMGSRELESAVTASLGVEFHETTADGMFSLEPVYCLGNCACSPAVMVDERVYGRVDAEQFEVIAQRYRQAGDEQCQ